MKYFRLVCVDVHILLPGRSISTSTGSAARTQAGRGKFLQNGRTDAIALAAK